MPCALTTHLGSALPQASVTLAATPLLALGRECTLTLGRGVSLGAAAEVACTSEPPFDDGMRLIPNCIGERKEAASGDSILGCCTMLPADSPCMLQHVARFTSAAQAGLTILKKRNPIE